MCVCVHVCVCHMCVCEVTVCADVRVICFVLVESKGACMVSLLTITLMFFK